jgi:hypothetical protein
MIPRKHPALMFPFGRIVLLGLIWLALILGGITLAQAPASAVSIYGPTTADFEGGGFYSCSGNANTCYWTVSGAGVTLFGDPTARYVSLGFPNAKVTATLTLTTDQGSASISIAVTRQLPVIPSNAISSDAPVINGYGHIKTGGSADFTVNVYGMGDGGYTSVWNYGDGVQDSLGGHVYTKAGAYYVTYKVTDNIMGGTVTSDAYILYVDDPPPPPSPVTHVNGPTTVDLSSTDYYTSSTANMGPSQSWSWSVTGTGVSLQSDAAAPYVYVGFPNAKVTANISCTYTCANGTSTGSLAVTSSRYLPHFPDPAISSDAPLVSGQPTVKVCQGVDFTVQVNGMGSGGYTTAWDYGDGTPTDSAAGHSYAKSGTYNVTYKITDNIMGGSVTSPPYSIAVTAATNNSSVAVVSETVYDSGDHSLTTCVNAPVTATFFAYGVNTPTSSCAGTVTGPTWSWGSGATVNADGTASITKTFTTPGDQTINLSATGTWMVGGTAVTATGSGSVTVHVTQTVWDAGDPITGGDPVNSSVSVAEGGTPAIALSPVTDTDHWQTTNGAQGTSPDNTLTYTWTCSDGLFGNGTTTSSTMDWVAPSLPDHQSKTVTLTCTIDDAPTPLSSCETGTKDDQPVTKTVTVTVNPGPWVEVSAGSVSDPFSFDADIWVGDDISGTDKISATLNNPPSTSGLTAVWSWRLGDQEYAVLDSELIMGPIPDGSTLKVVGTGDNSLTPSSATLNGDFPAEGYYSLQAVASVSFYDSSMHLVSGPFSSSGQTDGQDYIGH